MKGTLIELFSWPSLSDLSKERLANSQEANTWNDCSAIKLKLIYQNRESFKWDDNLIVKIYHKEALSLFNCTAIQELVNL